MSNKELSNKSSFVNGPAAYAGALAAVSAALIRMFSSPQYTENLLTISAALSPIFGVWIFGLLAKMKLSDAQIAMEEKIKRRMDFLDQQIASDSYSQEQKDKFSEEKAKLVLEYVNLYKTVE
ncbi:hypothetical protein [Pasteurella multocida]|uniref:hypothetical protein n=1 Tax=Pasteurella multocida TaxID=747 RepID=UPI000CCF8634|nr:hypothetical protein [Pasteurella multocida]PNW19690.1 hypothetical protein AP056_11345 [Pasteurella multocida subsp. multocida]